MAEEYVMIPLDIWRSFFNEAKQAYNNPDRANSNARLMLSLEEHSTIGKKIN